MSVTVVAAGDPPPADPSSAPSTPGAAPAAPVKPEPAFKQLGYESEEAMIKGHTELRTKMSKEGAPKADAPAAAPVADPAAATAAVAKAGLKMEDLQAEYLANGQKITEATYAKLEAAGVDRSLVDGFIAGQKAIAEQSSKEYIDHVGGPEKMTQIRTWATANLSQEDKDAFDGALDSGNKAAIKLALDGLKAKYEAAVGVDPSLRLNAEPGEAAGTDTYESWAQVRADMSDPRYDQDEAFRAKVEAKLGRSKL